MSAVFVACLRNVDVRIQAVSEALNSSSVEDLVNASTNLQQAVYQLHALLQRTSPVLLKQNLVSSQVNKAVAALTSVQENLLRRSMMTQQTLQTLIPTARSSTYGVGMGARLRQPYGSAGQRSGEFQVAVA